MRVLKIALQPRVENVSLTWNIPGAIVTNMSDELPDIQFKERFIVYAIAELPEVSISPLAFQNAFMNF